MKPLISADSHMIEHNGVWFDHLSSRFGDDAPHLAEGSGAFHQKFANQTSGTIFLCGGIPPIPLGGAYAAGIPADEVRAHYARGMEGLPAYAFSPSARLEAQDRDGVVGEVLYPTCCLLIYCSPNEPLRRAAFAAYNNYLVDYCKAAPSRLAGLAVLDIEDPVAAVAELERGVRMGLCGGLIPLVGPGRLLLSDARLNPLWAAAEDLGVPLSIHRSATATQKSFQLDEVVASYINVPATIQATLSQMVVTGVFDRFPRLKLVCAEFDVTWLPHFLDRLDRLYSRYGPMWGCRSDRMPSEAILSQVLFTVQNEGGFANLVGQIGASALLWASDFPHSDSTWPRSQTAVAEMFGKLREDEQYGLMEGSCRALYPVFG